GDGPVGINAFFFLDGGDPQQSRVVAYDVNPKFHFPRGDLALLLLEAPVAGVTPVPLAKRKARPRTQGTIVGYGTDEVGNLGNLGLKEMGTVRLKRCPRKVPALGLPAGSLNRSLCWQARAGEQNTCHGDSGGPLLIGDSLAGVTSGGDADCTGFLSWDTNVVPYLHWIRSHLR